MILAICHLINHVSSILFQALSLGPSSQDELILVMAAFYVLGRYVISWEGTLLVAIHSDLDRLRIEYKMEYLVFKE